MQITGCSIWYMLDEESSGSLQALITNLSRVAATPVFKPHITLLGQIQTEQHKLMPAFEQFAANLKPRSIQLDRPEMQDAFFRSLYLRVEPDQPLQELYLQAREHFRIFPSTPYLPHLSLLYSELDPETKQDLLAELHLRLPLKGIISNLTLMRTEGPPENWEPLSQRFLI